MFSPHDALPGEPGSLGMLVLDGLLLRAVALEQRPSLDVIGPGDVFRVCECEGDPDTPVCAQVGWWGLRPARLAVLDASFIRRMAEYPEVVGQLVSRFWRRSTASSLRLAIVQQRCLYARIHCMLWHLADRFGQVEPEGMVLPVPLCHSLLSWLVNARRPAVSRALKELERDEVIVCLSDGTWRLAGQPSAGVGELTASHPVAA